MSKPDDKPKWEIKDGDRRLAYGCEATMPTPQERKQFKAAGYQVYIDGKIWGR